jgi:hypothetical protein
MNTSHPLSHERGRIASEGRNEKEKDTMTDTSTQRPIQVSTESPSRPYIMLSVEVLEKVRKLLVENGIPHWVEHLRISVDGRPAVTVINLGRNVDSRRVQDLLDAAA